MASNVFDALSIAQKGINCNKMRRESFKLFLPSHRFAELSRMGSLQQPSPYGEGGGEADGRG